MLPRADGHDHRWTVTGADDDVVHFRRTVDEVPLLQRTLLAFGDQQRLTREHEEVLLVVLPVVHRHRVAGLEHEDVDSDLLELRVAVEAHHLAARAAVVPDDVACVDDEPALALGRQTVLRLLQPSLGNHAGP